MRNFSLAMFCGLLLVFTACSSSSSTPESSGEIRSEADVRSLFEAIVPDLVEAFTELANQQSLAASALSSTDKQANGTSSVPCPGGGTLVVDLVTGQATLSNCSAGGVTITASLALFVSQTGPSSYQAGFNGILMVSGNFTGTVEVNQASIEWTNPATVANTFWSVTVTVNDLIYIVTSADSGNGTLDCSPYDPPEGPNSGPPGAPCDEDGDCQANSCRDPIDNPSEGCTCRNLDSGGDCNECIGLNAAPPGQPANPATQCEGPIDFECSCLTQSGETVSFFLSGVGCIF